MKLLYGTTNRAKLDAMKKALAGLPIELIGLGDLSGPLPKIEEDGATPLENAQRKARAYYEAFGIPVFSCDSGLYFDEVQPQEQPGIYVRRVNGRELNDEEMIWHYAQLAQQHGGQLMARYKNAICLILDADNFFQYRPFALDRAVSAGFQAAPQAGEGLPARFAVQGDCKLKVLL